MIFNYKFDSTHQTKVDSVAQCPHCASHKWLLHVENFYAKVALGLISSRDIKIVVMCGNCNKKIKRKDWGSDVIKLAEQQYKQFKPSFFQRWGKLVIAVIVILMAIAFLISLISFD